MPGIPSPDLAPPSSPLSVPFPWTERRELASLPVTLTSLVGRDQELDHISDLLRHPDVRLLTLTGTGGIGKTRLAIRIGECLRASNADGVAFVSLAPVRDPDLMLPSVAQTLGVPDAAGQPVFARLRAFLAERKLLLVLDNLEHLLDAAPLVADLLRVAPRLTILCTSRTRLDVSGERVVTLAPLTADAARQLFVLRAGALDPAFALTPALTPVIDAICTRLDRLPLAIELAASRIPVLPPHALLARLTDYRLDVLTGGPRDAPPRLRAMRDTIAWSHTLLSEPEQVLFRRLGVFVGGFTLEAARAVAGKDQDVLAGVSALVAASLVIPVAGAGNEPRFMLLETIREYALERLDASGEDASTRRAHAGWIVSLSESAMPFWFSPQQKRWLDRMDAERDNLRAALTWLAEPARQSCAVHLVGIIWPFWFVCTDWLEGRTWLDRALAWSAGERTLQRMRVLNGGNCLAMIQHDASTAMVRGDESLLIERELGGVAVVDSPLVGIAIAAATLHDYDRAMACNEMILARYRGLGDTTPSAESMVSVILTNMALIVREQGDEPRAVGLVEEALSIQRRIGFEWGTLDSLIFLATVAEQEGDDARAVALYRESLGVATNTRDRSVIMAMFDRLAQVAIRADHHEQALRLLGAAERLREITGTAIAPDVRERVDLALSAARIRL